jgi:hypothetical protein
MFWDNNETSESHYQSLVPLPKDGNPKISGRSTKLSPSLRNKHETGATRALTETTTQNMIPTVI